MKSNEMWQRYAGDHADQITYEAWAFCGGGKVGDELAGLVLAGVKTATTSAYVSYQIEGEPVPEEGSYSVVMYDDGEAACVIRTTRVSLVPFNEVPASHAYLEGEGDRSLSYWRRVHREAFKPEYLAAGKDFDERDLCVLEEFELVYPVEDRADESDVSPHS